MSRTLRLSSLVATLLLAALLACSEQTPRGAEPSVPSAPAGEAAHAGEAADEIAWWTCPMHPSVHAKHAGKCPICGMTLVPVLREEIESGEIRIDAAQRERAGIQTAAVARGALELVVRAVGRVAVDETALVDVSLKVGGFVSKLSADSLGAPVRRGDTLLLLYSPDLYAAQQELLQALRGASAPGAARGDALARAARKRLSLWGIADADVAAIVRRGEPQDALPIRSPASGYVIEKNVVEGASVEAGARLLRIAPLDRVWIEAAVQEDELALLSVGQTARVRLPARPGTVLEGEIGYVYPNLSPDTRTGRIRIELPNPDHALLPDMQANVELRIEHGDRLLVPVTAVIFAGPRRVVFVDLGEGRLAPRDVEIGAGNGDVYEVIAGLEAGEQIVISGNFLVAAESRLKSAASRW